MIVGVGASAGGLEALEELFENMPADTGIRASDREPTGQQPVRLGRRTQAAVSCVEELARRLAGGRFS